MYSNGKLTRVFKAESTHFDLVRSAPVVYLLIDQAGRIVDANVAAFKLLREHGGALIGRNVLSLFGQAHRQPFATAVGEAVRKTQARECRLILQGGGDVRAIVHIASTSGALANYCLVALYRVTASSFRRSHTLKLEAQTAEDHDTLPCFRAITADTNKETLLDSRLAAMHALQAQPAQNRNDLAPDALPPDAPPPDALPLVGAPHPPSSEIRTAPLKVLVATYDSRLATLLIEIMEGLGIRYDIAPDGVQALRKLQGSTRYNAVIIDSGTRLPIIDWHTLTRLIADSNGRRIKVLALTSGPLRHEHEASLAAGCDLHHYKVYDRIQLTRYVEELTYSCNMADCAYL